MKRAWFLVCEAFSNLLIHRSSVVIGVVTTAFTITCFGVFFLLYFNLKSVTGSLQDEIEVMVYLHNEVSREQRLALQRNLEQREGVANLEFVSQQQALEDFHRQFPDESSLLEGLGENPLPASFVLRIAPAFHATDSLGVLVDQVKEVPGVEHVRYSREWVETLSILVRYIELGAVMVGGMLALATVTIFVNTIRLSLYARKEEIEILRLIGATGTFIATPYLLEGAILGGLGGGLSIMLLKSGFEFFRLEVDASGWFQGLQSALQFFPFHISLFLVIGGMVLGSMSSLLSVYTILRVKA
ncbi:MAG: ABC transporter permease [Nitrospirae bacterium]|nr:ABC transporter permease [Nitrospirota bacterium]